MSAREKFDAFIRKADGDVLEIEAWKTAVHCLNEDIKAYFDKEFGGNARCTSNRRLLSDAGQEDRPYELEYLNIVVGKVLPISAKASPTGNSVTLECRDRRATLEWSGGGATLSNWSLRGKPRGLAISDINADADTVSLPQLEGKPLEESTLEQVIEQLIPD
jgi:hypothetical protein